MNWTRNGNVLWEEFNDGALLIDPASGKQWKLNAEAAEAWKLFDGSRTLADVVNLLRRPAGSVAEFCRVFGALGLLDNGGVLAQNAVFSAPLHGSFSFQPLGLGAGPRRRPAPRGVSGPG